MKSKHFILISCKVFAAELAVLKGGAPPDRPGSVATRIIKINAGPDTSDIACMYLKYSPYNASIEKLLVSIFFTLLLEIPPCP